MVAVFPKTSLFWSRPWAILGERRCYKQSCGATATLETPTARTRKNAAVCSRLTMLMCVSGTELARKIGAEAGLLRRQRGSHELPRIPQNNICPSVRALSERVAIIVAGHRLKRSGMFRTVKRANSILALSCSSVGSRFDELSTPATA